MKIIHCFREPVGGLFRHVCDLARHQSAQGHEVGFICDSTTGGQDADMTLQALSADLSLGMFRLPMAREMGPSDVATTLKVRQHIRRLGPDLIHAHGAKGGAYARLSRLLPGMSSARVVYCAHGGSLHYDPSSLKGRIFFLVERALEQLTDGIIFVCAFEETAYANKVGAPRIRSRIIHNGIAPSERIPVPPAPDATDFLYIGAMRDLKGPDLLLDAVGLMTEKGVNISLTMVGDGPDKPRYEEMAARASLAGRVRFYPQMPARQAFALGHCVVLPSRAESFPYIVLEAIGAAKPLIASKVGGVPEIFGAHADQLFAPGDAVALADKMDEFIENRKYFNDLKEHLHDVVSERFSIDAMSRSVMGFYEELCR